jgi:hypothetical protein
MGEIRIDALFAPVELRSEKWPWCRHSMHCLATAVNSRNRQSDMSKHLTLALSLIEKPTDVDSKYRPWVGGGVVHLQRMADVDMTADMSTKALYIEHYFIQSTSTRCNSTPPNY